MLRTVLTITATIGHNDPARGLWACCVPWSNYVPEPYQAGNTEPASHPTSRRTQPWRFVGQSSWQDWERIR